MWGTCGAAGGAGKTLAALPETVQERYLREDSACYDHTLLRWLCNGKRENGSEQFIGSAVSARVNDFETPSDEV
jgi:hypothetical protein